MTELTDAQVEIDKHRAVIDSLDEQIVALLNKRAEQIFERLEGFNDGPMYNDDIREIYATVLKVMKEIRA